MSRRRRRLGHVAALGVAVAWLLAPVAGEQRAAAETPAPIELAGAGSASLEGALSPTWQDAMYGASAPVDVAYTFNGDVAGKKSFTDGTADFVVSGLPFTLDELAMRPGGADSIIEIPIEATAATAVAAGPSISGEPRWALDAWRWARDQAPCDPDTADKVRPDDECLALQEPWTGELNIPTSNLAAMLLFPASTSTPAATELSELARWSHPDVKAAMAIPATDALLGVSPRQGPSVGVRGDESADNFYLQTWAKTSTPEVWSLFTQTDAGYPFEPIKPVMRGLSSRTTAGLLAQALADEPNGDFLTGVSMAQDGRTTGVGSRQGKIAVLPPWGLAYARSRQTTLDQFNGFRVVRVENAVKRYVAPTTESITLAIELGGGRPLFGSQIADFAPLDDATAAQVYPLTWLNHLYAPKTGLTIDKTNALAGFVRYVVTAGQDVLAADGDGRLPPALQRHALDTVNGLVSSNCDAAGGVTVAGTTIEPYGPANLTGIDLGEVRYCHTAPPATTTTLTTLASTTTGAATRPASGPAVNPRTDPVVTTTPRTTTPTGTTTTRATTTTRPATTSPTTIRPTTIRPTTIRPTTIAAPRADKREPGAVPAAVELGPEGSDEAALPAQVAAAPVAAAPAGAAPAATTTTTKAAPPRVTLPFALPGDGKGRLDRASTLLLGASVYGTGLRRIRRRRGGGLDL